MAITGAFIMPHPPIILPEIGRGEEHKIQSTIDACREVARRIAALRPDTIVLTSPHSVMYADYFHISPGETASGDLSQFDCRQVKMTVRYDDDFVKRLSDKAAEEEIDAGTMGQRSTTLDHGTMIPLSFVNKEYADYRLVRIGLSGLSPLTHYRLGQLISRTAAELNRNVVFLASGDLSHKLTADGPYGFAAEGPLFDGQVTEAMAKGDFLRFLTFDADFCENAAECGLRSFMIMAGALDRKAVHAQLLSHEGPFGVGYGVAAFAVEGDDPARNFGEQYELLQTAKMAAIKNAEDPYVRLARLSVETYVRTGRKATLPDGLPEEMLSVRAGAFVSLKKDGTLRGCIGTILPTTSCVAKEILRNAVSACSEDPRFEAVRPEELDALVYDVDVLGQPEDIAEKSQLDVKRYGVIVSHGTRRGLLLPDLAGVDSVEQQIEIARQKAGIGKNEKITLQRFEVVRHL